MNEHKPVFSVRISQDLVDHVDELVERTGVSRADIVERCLAVGLKDEKEFVAWLESPVKGPLVSLLMHPKILAALLSLTGGEADETQVKIKENFAAKRRKGSGRHGKTAIS